MDRKTKTLYKYTKMDYVRSCIEKGVHASKLDKTLNDPFESAGIENKEKYRIACLTTNTQNKLMWSFYAQNHQGCCIGFDVTDVNRSFLRKVSYTQILRNKAEYSSVELVDRLFYKGYEWHSESEWRAVYYSDNHYSDTIWNTDEDGNIFLNLKVVSVTFGVNSELNPLYCKALEYLLNYNKGCRFKKDQITIRKMRLSDKNYNVVQDKQYDPATVLNKMLSK